MWMRRVPFSGNVLLTVFLCALAFGPPAFSQTTTAPPRPTQPGSATSAQVPGAADPRAAMAAGTARIRGRIVVAQTGAPLRRAQVSLGSFSAAQTPTGRTTTTDNDGRFEFTNLAAGRYSVAVMKTGFVSLQYGQQRPTDPFTTFTLADGERRDGIDLALPRGGVIVVRIIDDFGEPLPGTQVQVQRYQYSADGQRRLSGVFVPGVTGMNVTDDRGDVRIYGLPPGDYIVSASNRNPIESDPNGGNNNGFSITFHPGTVNPAEAQAISLTMSEEILVEFALSTTRLSRISGSAVDSQGRPAGGSFVQIVGRQGSSVLSAGSGGQVQPDGTFSVTGVSPGEYTLEVRPMMRTGSNDSPEFASVPIVVADSDITGVRIVTGRGATITGRVVFEGGAPRGAAAGQMRVMSTAADPSRPAGNIVVDPRSNGVIEENGGFQLTGQSGRVFLLVTAPGGWTTKSISLQGEDVTDQPIDLTGQQSVTGVVIRMTNNVTHVSGQVTDGRGERSRECTVVFQAAEQHEPVIAARWMRTVRCDSSGAFQTRGMRPGRYVVSVVRALEQGRQFDPEFQQNLRQASQSFEIRDGETKTLDLKLTSGL